MSSFVETIKSNRPMIARIWHGRVKPEHFEEYTEFMRSRAIPDYRKTEGFEDLLFLRDLKDDAGHFTMITTWTNLEVIKNFAGADYIKAKYYPEDSNYLLELEEEVKHHEVFAH